MSQIRQGIRLHKVVDLSARELVDGRFERGTTGRPQSYRHETPVGRRLVTPYRCGGCGGKSRVVPCMVCRPPRVKIARPMPPPPDDARFHLPIAELEQLDMRWVNALEEIGVVFVGQLLMLPPHELDAKKGHGPGFRRDVLAAARKLMQKPEGVN